MKNYIILAISAALSLGLVSCGESYFDVDLEQNIKTPDAYRTVQDVQNGMIGAFNSFGSYQFYGRDVVALGDIGSALAKADASSGHFYSIFSYSITDTDEDLENIWDYGYKTIDKCTRTIQGAKAVLESKEELKLDEEEVLQVENCIAECYALRALSTFTLTNIFGLPYNPTKANNQLGVALLDEQPLQPFEQTERKTVEECYDKVLSDIDDAESYYVDDSFLPGEAGFFLNSSAISALRARVYLYMGRYADAKEAAENALSQLKNGNNYDLPSNDIYVSSWSSIATNDETIFSVCKTNDDNLSANALNTLYGSYGATVSSYLEDAFEENDIRAKVLDVYAYKYQGISTAQSVSNIPVFRKSEMYLIIAECAAQLNQISEAKQALLFTAKRNTDITSVDDLPSSSDELLTFIANERVRELYLEGHRWFDARRTGITIDVMGGAATDFDVAKFVYPIPAAEINAGFGIVQNTGWEDYLPE